MNRHDELVIAQKYPAQALIGMTFFTVALALGCMPTLPSPASCSPPMPRSVVIVIEENHGYWEIINNPDAPYINRLTSEGARPLSFGMIYHVL